MRTPPTLSWRAPYVLTLAPLEADGVDDLLDDAGIGSDAYFDLDTVLPEVRFYESVVGDHGRRLSAGRSAARVEPNSLQGRPWTNGRAAARSVIEVGTDKGGRSIGERTTAEPRVHPIYNGPRGGDVDKHVVVTDHLPTVRCRGRPYVVVGPCETAVISTGRRWRRGQGQHGGTNGECHNSRQGSPSRSRGLQHWRDVTPRLVGPTEKSSLDITPVSSSTGWCARPFPYPRGQFDGDRLCLAWNMHGNDEDAPEAGRCRTDRESVDLKAFVEPNYTGDWSIRTGVHDQAKDGWD